MMMMMMTMMMMMFFSDGLLEALKTARPWSRLNRRCPKRFSRKAQSFAITYRESATFPILELIKGRDFAEAWRHLLDTDLRANNLLIPLALWSFMLLEALRLWPNG